MFSRVLVCLLAISAVCSGTGSRNLTKLHQDYFAWQLKEHPLSATLRGVHMYDDQLERLDRSSLEARKNKSEDFLDRLHRIDQTEFSKDDNVNYRILENMLSTYIEGYKWFNYQHLNPVNSRGGPQFDYQIADIMSFNTRGDFENYIVRLTKLPQQYEEYKSLMREAIQLNRTNHNYSMAGVEGQFQKLQGPVNESLFYKPFGETLDNSTVDKEDLEDIRNRGKAAVVLVQNASNSLWEFIRDEYLPNTRSEIGLSSWNGGLDFYAACIRWHLSENRTALEVYNIGLKEVDRIANNMQKIMAKHGFSGTPGDYYRSFRNDSRFFFNTGEEIMDEYRHLINNVIDPKLDSYFVNIPDLPLEVRPMEADGPRGSYSSGSADGTRPGVFWANVHRPDDFANFTFMPLVLHEANPGHHMQISIAITSDTPDFRQKMIANAIYRVPFSFPSFTAYAEGWGLYSEYLGEEMELYRNDYELMGRYSDEMFRACRLVVDTGIHAFNWTREQSIQYFLNYTSGTYESTVSEVDRYISWPGQALAYKMGEIKIKEFRDYAENQLGSKFNIREFHSVMLENGRMPLSVMEDMVKDWVDTYPMTTSAPLTPKPVTCGASNPVSVYLWTLFCVLLTAVHY